MRIPAGLLPIGCILLLAGCGSGGTPPSSPVTSRQSTTAAPAATAVPSPGAVAQGPSGSAAPAGFAAASVTFVSLREGWVLGSVPCASGLCPVLLRTQDGGRTWVAIPAPSSTVSTGPQTNGVREVRFADANDGWVYGPELWSTHDGGAHWTREDLPVRGSVEALETSAGAVHAVVFAENGGSNAVEIESSPAGRDSWTASPTTIPFGAGPVPQAQLVLQGTAGWILENDRTIVGGARLTNGHWSTWQPPCTGAGGPAVLAASSVSNLDAVCDEGIWTGTAVAVRAYRSSDGGATMQRIGTAIPCSFNAQLASPGPSTAVLGCSLSDGTDVLMATFDSAATWTIVDRASKGGSWNDVGFTSPTQGVAVEIDAAGKGGSLLMTFDGGHHWAPVSFASG